MDEYIDYFQNLDYFDEHAEWLSDHIDAHFPDAEITVFHELITFDVKVHVYFIQPKDKKYNILITSGMSSLAMQVPEEIEDKENYLFAELMLLIPKEVTFNNVYTGQNKNDFIISMLKQTAKFPHQYQTWMGIGHTIRASEDLEPYSNETEFIGGVMLPSATFDEDFTEIKRNGRLISILSFFPLYENELAYKIENGYNSFIDLIIKANALEILDNKRPNLISTKPFWKKFL